MIFELFYLALYCLCYFMFNILKFAANYKYKFYINPFYIYQIFIIKLYIHENPKL